MSALTPTPYLSSHTTLPEPPPLSLPEPPPPPLPELPGQRRAAPPGDDLRRDWV